ncbi:amidase [Glaciecola petra]|uniref:Amidase n=1 Tax=Glaciecola petra TaxID=3075602 RepID=A0ABU2ZR17_9ALTE|nr:amidase [Aestuariibacter sp. P117]MDT0595080.1 amidase [Aestuariibacter sp. P117]
MMKLSIATPKLLQHIYKCRPLLILLGITLGSISLASANVEHNANWLVGLPAHEQAKLIAKQTIRSEELVVAYLNRIEKMDRKGPRVQAMLSLNENAIAEAKQKDKEVQEGGTLGRLHGVVVVVKDNIDTSELPTTAGSMALIANNTKRDAPIIAKLKAEGAVILGKTNLSEWANFRDDDSISGWSAVGGQTRNPHSLDRTPCGSSSGSGAAIAAQFASLAIGTETNGSVICPSTMNGIVGVKPTVGLLSRTHIVPISVTQDTAGPMTRNVKDAALMLTIMAGSDKNDPATLHADSKKQNYVDLLEAPLKGKRVGVLRSTQSKHPDIIAKFNEALKVLESQGVTLVDINELKTPDKFWDKSLKVLLIEFKHELNKYLASTPKSVSTRNLQALIDFNNKTPRQLVLFGQSLFIDAQSTEGYNEEYEALVEFLRQATRTNGIDRMLRENNLDFLVSPSQTPAFLIDAVFGDSFPGGFAGAGWMAAIAGYPHVSVPMGDMRGLPLGLSFIGKAFDDGVLLNAAFQYEQASKKILTPSFAQGPYDHASLQEATKALK